MVVSSWCLKVTKEELKQKIDDVDVERNGKISFSEVSLYHKFLLNWISWVRFKIANFTIFAVFFSLLHLCVRPSLTSTMKNACRRYIANNHHDIFQIVGTLFPYDQKQTTLLYFRGFCFINCDCADFALCCKHSILLGWQKDSIWDPYMERPIVGGLANIGSFKSAFPRPSASLTAMETGRLILVKPPFQTKFYVCVWNYPMEFKTMKY